MRALIIIAALALASCAPKPPVERIVIQEVKIPVPVPCDPQVGPEPLYADNAEALAAAPNILEAMRLRAIGRFERIARDQLKTAALDGCRSAGPPPDPG